jgi:CRISPR system Cascade subunit CasA
MMRQSLLDDPVFSVRLGDGRVAACALPDVLHALSQEMSPLGGDVVAFDQIQPHQQQAWHCFLTQLAAMTIEQAAEGTVPGNAAAWRAALVALAKGSEAAWHLVVEDLGEPAFMQPPAPEGTFVFKDDLASTTPDQIDVLITSKNHEVKSHRFTRSRVEHWVYALVTLQTTEGYLGPGNYGISRMNSGSANRVFVGLTPSLAPGPWFRRDVAMLRTTRAATAEAFNLTLGGTSLLWLEPWDGEDTINLHDCDPHYIEVCRRVRFAEDGVCYRAGSSTYRMHPKSGDIKGITGDPWAPIDKQEGKVLNLSGDGFTYRKLHEILFSGRYRQPPSMQHQLGEEDMAYLVLRTLVRGQGTTEGLHERVVPIAGYDDDYFGEGPAAAQIARESELRVAQAQKVRTRVLRPALAAYLGDPSDPEALDPVWRHVRGFDERVVDVFFERLWDAPGMTEAERRTFWDDQLLAAARAVFADGLVLCPASATRRWPRRSLAQNRFDGFARATLKHATDFHG